MAVVSARPLDTVEYNQAPIELAFRNSFGSIFVPGRIFKVIEIPVLYQISYSTLSSTSPAQAPVLLVNPPPETSLPASVPALEPEPNLPSAPIPSPEVSNLPAPTPDPTALSRIPVSTRPPNTPHHRRVDSETLNGGIEEIPSGTVEPTSTKPTPLDEKNSNNVLIQEDNNPPTAPSLIHHSGN